MDSVWVWSKWPTADMKTSLYVERLRSTPKAAMRIF